MIKYWGPRKNESGPILIVGRASDVDYRVEGDDYVSPYHCRFFRQGKRLFVEDLGSSNGTHVDHGFGESRARDASEVLPGTRVRIGRTILPVPEFPEEQPEDLPTNKA